MVIIGAKGLAKELLTVLQWNGEIEDVFLFDNVNSDAPDILYDRFRVIKSWEALERHFSSNAPHFILGVGGAKARAYCSEKAISLGGKLQTIVSKQALVGAFGVRIGSGVGILSHVIITADVEIGEGTLLNKSAIVSHDARVGKYCEISPGARILGRASVGDRTEIGANAVILPGVLVGSDCRVGAGAVVTKNVAAGLTVVGIPARSPQKSTS
jgi:sugar O-acyltransferase (sialic acid O-acetyltransferase NeuD family)